MPEHWVRYTLTAELLSDAHFGSGAGGRGIDALVARDRYGHPVIWASHIEGVLRDAARRLHGDKAAADFFGRAGGERQRAVFTSLYADADPVSHVWRSTARASFDNRAPKDETLRVIEYVPRGTKLVGQVELPESELHVLQRLVQEVDALGSGRASGAGRVELSLASSPTKALTLGSATGRFMLLLKNLDPVCITATATPDNLIPSLAFVPGRALLGAIAAWLIAEGDRDTASLLVGGRVAVNDALPVPEETPLKLEAAEVLPAPLSLQSPKPRGSAGEVPWWAQPKAATRRLNAWGAEAEQAKKQGVELKRPKDDLFVYRAGPGDEWITFRPSRRVRLRNGRSKPDQADASLFAIEQIVEATHFLCELNGSPEDMARLADKLAPVFDGRRWLRVGRAGAPIEVVRVAWAGDPSPAKTLTTGLLILTSDLLVRDQYLRWCTAIDVDRLTQLPGCPDDVQITRALQDSGMVHGFNGTSRLWRMPVAVIRRGSVFEVLGTGVARLAQMAARGQWLGERTHEGFGRFRIDTKLPGVTDGSLPSMNRKTVDDADEETAAVKAHGWLQEHMALAKLAVGEERKPSLSQWFDLVTELESEKSDAIEKRLDPKTAGGQSWRCEDAKAILDKLKELPTLEEQAVHARLFVRWLRPVLKAELRKGEE